MKALFVSVILIIFIATGIILTTCGPAYNPFNEIVTNYKRDYDYLERTFFWVFLPEDSVRKIIDANIYVYINLDYQPDQDFAWNYANVAIDPDNFGEFPKEDRFTTVRKLDLSDYRLSNDSLYMEMFTYDRNKVIAGWFMVETNSGDTIEVGSLANDTLLLKLIALENNVADADCQTWKNEWRNVYSLGRLPIDTNYYELQVYLGEPGTETHADKNLNHQNGTPYIQILGLDVSGYYDSLPDGRIDCSNRAIFWPEKAYLFLPDPNPFDPDTSYAINNAQLQVTVPEIYNTRRSTITSNPTQYTEYYFEFKWAE